MCALITAATLRGSPLGPHPPPATANSSKMTWTHSCVSRLFVITVLLHFVITLCLSFHTHFVLICLSFHTLCSYMSLLSSFRLLTLALDMNDGYHLGMTADRQHETEQALFNMLGGSTVSKDVTRIEENIAQWTCSLCTLINHQVANACTACGSSRHESLT